MLQYNSSRISNCQ